MSNPRPKIAFNLNQIDDPVNEKLYRFLDYISRILQATGAPYVRDLVALDYLTSTLQMDYKTAENFLEELRTSGLIQDDQHGAFPGCFLTENGRKILGKLQEFFSQTEEKSRKTPMAPSKPYIMGKTQESQEEGSNQRQISFDKFPEDLIYRFLHYHINVTKNATVPYLRDMVAESYLMEIEQMGYQQVADFLQWLVENGILAYNQFGAFPGTAVTADGRKLFEILSKKHE